MIVISTHYMIFYLDDPRETTDLSANNTDLVREIKQKIQTYMLESPYPVFPPMVAEGWYWNFGGVWSPGWCNVSDIEQLLIDAQAGIGSEYTPHSGVYSTGWCNNIRYRTI